MVLATWVAPSIHTYQSGAGPVAVTVNWAELPAAAVTLAGSTVMLGTATVWPEVQTTAPGLLSMIAVPSEVPFELT